MKRVFVDTNVFCYVHDDRVPLKQNRARELLLQLEPAEYWACVSTQVLQEFYNTLVHKFKMPAVEAKVDLNPLLRMEVVVISPSIIPHATDLHATASLSFWDALIIAAAQSTDCDEVWSEDLQEARVFGKVQVVNPFRG